MNQSHLIAGIDVSKAEFILALHGQSGTHAFDNSVKGFNALRRFLQQRDVTAIALEASGGYERGLLRHLQERAPQVTLYLLQPHQVRCFAKAANVHAKTDAIDAQMIAQFAAVMQPRAYVPPPTVCAELRELLQASDMLGVQRVMLRNRLETLTQPLARQQLEKQMKHMAKAQTELDQAIVTLVKAEPVLSEKLKLFLSMPGIGIKTACVLLAELQELGTLETPQLAALVGVAPHPRDSGTIHGKRSIRGGRKRVRQALFMAARGALNCKTNNPFKAFFQNLTARGKPYKLAITALMRKMIATLNAIAKSMQPFQNTYLSQPTPA